MQSQYCVLNALSDSELVQNVKRLVRRECEATAELIASLGELDRRRLYVGLGYSSMFVYCVQALRLSEDAAYSRIEVARAALRFPLVLERLGEGAVSLTGARLLVPHLTEENHRGLLAEAAGKSKRDIEEIVARLKPRPDVAPLVRRLPAARAVVVAHDAPIHRGSGGAGAHAQARGEMSLLVQGDAAVPAAGSVAVPSGEFDMAEPRSGPVLGRILSCNPADGAAETSGGARPRAEPALAQPAASAARRDRSVVAPLAPARYKVQMTIGAETRARLQHAQNLLRHAVPDGNIAEIFDRALVVLIEQLERKKWAKSNGRAVEKASPAAATRKRNETGKRITAKREQPELVPEQVGPHCSACVDPTAAGVAPHPKSRHIPAAVKRAAWRRALGQCTFVAADGTRCSARDALEFHHLHPYATGGPATVTNVTVLCRRHNGHEAELYFGRVGPPRDPWSRAR